MTGHDYEYGYGTHNLGKETWFYVQNVCNMSYIAATDVPALIQGWILESWFHDPYASAFLVCNKLIALTSIDCPDLSQHIQTIQTELDEFKKKVYHSLESIQEVEVDEQGMIKKADFAWWLYSTVKMWQSWLEKPGSKLEYRYKGENRDVWILMRVLLSKLTQFHFEMGVLLTFISEIQREKDQVV